MADLPSGFWSGWVLVLTLVGSGALLLLVLGIYRQRQRSAQAGEDDTVWDGDLQEGNNPAPLWWFWLILTMMVFSVGYLMLYPGLGALPGMLHWSQQAQLHEHAEQHASTHAPRRQAVIAMSVEQLAVDQDAMAAAARVFADNCSACHGLEARGQANLFPDLRDGDWLWGGSAEQIEQTIRNGRKPIMPNWLPALQDSGVAQVADYVKVMATPAAAELPGHVRYQQFCGACHGPEGNGNPLLGAPRLNDQIWLYGGSDAALRQSIANGRKGEMPAFGGRLNDLEVKLLVAWLLRP